MSCQEGYINTGSKIVTCNTYLYQDFQYDTKPDCVTSNWTVTGERNTKIQFDINSNPLQVFTNSEIGSVDLMWTRFITHSGKGTGLSVLFESIPSYYIGSCGSERINIPLNKLGTDNHRVWTIKRENSAVKLFCNGVDIFHYDTKTSNEKSCEDAWSLDFAVLKFPNNTASNGNEDNASDSYRRYTTGKGVLLTCTGQSCWII